MTLLFQELGWRDGMHRIKPFETVMETREMRETCRVGEKVVGSTLTRMQTAQWINKNCLGLAGKQSVDWSGELVAALEELQLEDEDEAQQVTTHLADHFATSPSGAT